MRVDHHLLRRMLETLEAAPSAELKLMPSLTIDAVAQRYHLQLLIDGGQVSARQLRRYGRACALSLTLAGQELLEKMRSKKIRRVQIWMERLLAVSLVRLLFGPG
jgi:hypothetical protein